MGAWAVFVTSDAVLHLRSAQSVFLGRNHRGSDDMDRAQPVQPDRAVHLFGDRAGLRMDSRSLAGRLWRHRFLAADRNLRDTNHTTSIIADASAGPDRIAICLRRILRGLESVRTFVTIEVLARPGSRRIGLLRVEARGLVIGVASPAEKGRANEELIATIANMAGVPRDKVSILRGSSSAKQGGANRDRSACGDRATASRSQRRAKQR